MIRKEDFVHRNVSHCIKKLSLGFPGGSLVKNCLPVQETWVQPLGLEDPL